MDEIEKKKRLESLDDLKVIRYNTGNSFFVNGIFMCMLGLIISLGFVLISIKLNYFPGVVIFTFSIVLFWFIEMFLIYKQEKQEEKFLLKYGKNK